MTATKQRVQEWPVSISNESLVGPFTMDGQWVTTLIPCQVEVRCGPGNSTPHLSSDTFQVVVSGLCCNKPAWQYTPWFRRLRKTCVLRGTNDFLVKLQNQSFLFACASLRTHCNKYRGMKTSRQRVPSNVSSTVQGTFLPSTDWHTGGVNTAYLWLTAHGSQC